MKNESNSSIAFIKILIEKVFALRYVYIACVFIFLVIAFIYNKYSQKVVEINSTIGPVEDTRSTILSSNQMFGNIGSYNSGKDIEDAINSLNSFSLISATISSLSLEVGYFAEKKGILNITTEMYKNSPFIVQIEKSHAQAINTKFYITLLNDSTYRLKATNDDATLYNYIDNTIVQEKVAFNIDTISFFNRIITGKNYRFSVSFRKDLLPADKRQNDQYYFELYHTEELAKYYLANLKIEPVSIMASIINLKFKGSNINKSIDFLNSYVNLFLEENLAKKNKIAISTVNFIDSQISEISDSLAISESKLRQFRASNKLSTDLSFQGQRIYDQLEQIESDLADLETRSRYYNYIINYVRTNQNMSGVVPPTSANITDPIMNQLITDLIESNAEKSRLLSNNSNKKNLFLNEIESKIKLQKQSIIENASNSLNTINLTINDLNYKSEKLTREIVNLPKTEMNMVNIQRKFKLNDAIFTFLLQKRSEAAISLASNYPDYEVLEPAREITSKLISPKTTMNYILALFIALLLPTIFLIIKDFLNDKISGVYDVENIIERPIMGILYNNPKKYESVVMEAPRSAISESFRNIRSSIFFKLKTNEPKVILISSSQPQEGKSFVSFNLAASIATVGNKTVILDCDLRRPVLHEKFKEENKSGISDFMVKRLGANKIIRDTSHENLSFIPAGPIIPNPSELIDSGVLEELINYLKSKFEYIIIDTSPIGLISDSMQLMKYATMILIVTRNNSTQKSILANALNSLKSNEISNYEVVLNDLELKKSPYSGYKSYYFKE